MRSPLSGIRKFEEGGYVEEDYVGEDYINDGYSEEDIVSPLSSYSEPVPQNDKFFPLLPNVGYKDSTIPMETRNRMALEAARQFFAPASRGGGSFTSDISNVLGGVSAISDENQKQRQLLEALRMKSENSRRMGEARNKASLERTKMVTGARIEAAEIAARAKAAKQEDDYVRTLSAQEVAEMDLPAGTVAQHNSKTGRVNILYSPPKTSSGGVVTGYDENGKPIVSQSLSKKVIGDMQKYVINAEGMIPEIDSLIKEMEEGKTGQSALGVTGAIERGLETTVGQAKNLLTGDVETLFPEDTKFRSRLKKLNERLIPTLTSDPRISVKTRGDIKKMMVDPDKWGEGAGDALVKLKSIRDQLKTTTKQYKTELGETEEAPTPKTKPKSEFEGMTKEQIKEAIRKMSPEERAALHERMTNAR